MHLSLQNWISKTLFHGLFPVHPWASENVFPNWTLRPKFFKIKYIPKTWHHSEWSRSRKPGIHNDKYNNYLFSPRIHLSHKKIYSHGRLTLPWKFTYSCSFLFISSFLSCKYFQLIYSIAYSIPIYTNNMGEDPR